MVEFTINRSETFDSENLYNKIQQLQYKQIEQIKEGLEWMHEHAPKAVLIGGTAVVSYLYGGRNLTPDLDFLSNSFESIILKVEEQGLTYTNLIAHNGIKIGFTITDFNLDILNEKVGNQALNKLILQNPNKMKIGGEQVLVIMPELLAIMKLDLGRNRDLEDALAIMRTLNVSKQKYLDCLAQLGKYLKNYEYLHAYAAIISN